MQSEMENARLVIVMAQYRWREKRRESAEKRAKTGGPRRRCVIARGDEFLTVAASGGQPRNAREFPGNKSMYNN